MALTSADLARLGPQAQKQVLDKLAGTQKPIGDAAAEIITRLLRKAPARNIL